MDDSDINENISGIEMYKLGVKVSLSEPRINGLYKKIKRQRRIFIREEIKKGVRKIISGCPKESPLKLSCMNVSVLSERVDVNFDVIGKGGDSGEKMVRPYLFGHLSDLTCLRTYSALLSYMAPYTFEEISMNVKRKELKY